MEIENQEEYYPAHLDQATLVEKIKMGQLFKGKIRIDRDNNELGKNLKNILLKLTLQ